MSLSRDISRNLVAISGSLSMRALSDASGVSERTIVSVRQGPISGTLPHMRTIEKLASGLRISTSMFCAEKKDVVLWGKLSMRQEYYKKENLFESGKPDYQISRTIHKKHKLKNRTYKYAHAFLIAAFASRSLELAESFAEHYVLFDQDEEMFM